MFQPVTSDKLVIGTKYRIVGNCQYYGTFIGPMPLYPQPYLMFDNVCNETHSIYVRSKLLLPTCKFSQFVSQKALIQTNMEMRSVNLVVRRILGDEHFKW